MIAEIMYIGKVGSDQEVVGSQPEQEVIRFVLPDGERSEGQGSWRHASKPSPHPLSQREGATRTASLLFDFLKQLDEVTLALVFDA